MGHHFVLIHGGSHGAWAWAKTVDRLQKAGCKATALDLASAGNDCTDPNFITTWAEYNKPVVDFFGSLPDDEKVVLISHSMGGYTNPELMESFPQSIAVAIFVSAAVTPSGVALFDSPLADLDIELAKTLVKWYPIQTPRVPTTYTKERHGQVPAMYCEELRDSTLLLSAQNFLVENYEPFKEVIEVDAGHFSPWSHADEFVELILLLADKYDVPLQM